ncbi:Bcr/CflA family drug resistance efflux transporter [Campylobacter ornithocola]|uniref:Bcr/CflA family drug resistance efflux transporter n=1 Tax=Campylobacter ornithocola TaxID=1848766 RepID=A0A6M8MWK7_9BACT|nr:multidrug effflux MFS transporter [Campylobacter ornithocola]OCX43031.1 Bcr/CflA family drug resistance efflux transporter [Campylobacter ornithocola]QKF56679.1 drug resistance transporter, Bcr/CflA family [Campylobacter ornithocola]
MQKRTQIKGFEKLKLIIILAFLSSIAPLSTDMYLPALNEVEKSFQTNSFYTQLSLASFFIAFSLGQLFYGPLSDVYGRKKPLYIGIFIFVSSSIACVLVDSIHAFIALRFFEALGGCVGVVVARAIVNDVFELKEAAGIYALMMVFTSLAPMLSPTFGGILLEFFSWRSIFLTLFILGFILFLLVIFALKESNHNTEGKKFNHKEVAKSYKKILKDRRFVVYLFCGNLIFAGFFAYLTGSSFVFTRVFELSEQQYAMLFGINALGFVVFANINARLALRYSPYYILPRAFISVAFLACLLILGATFELGFLAFELPLFFIIASLGFILPNTTTLAMARSKQNAGSASALLGAAQFAMAGFMAFLVSLLNANTPILLASILGICTFLGAVFYLSLINKRKFGKIKRKLSAISRT